MKRESSGEEGLRGVANQGPPASAPQRRGGAASKSPRGAAAGRRGLEPPRKERSPSRAPRSGGATTTRPPARSEDQFFHALLPGGVEFAADLLPHRHTLAFTFRMLSGVADDPPDLTGISAIVERTLAKGTVNYDGRGLADAFDQRGIEWSSATGRQSVLVRALALPEFAGDVIDLVAEMFCRPTFPDEAVRVAVELAQQELRHLDDDPQELIRVLTDRITLGPLLGRYPGGTLESLPRITPEVVRAHWQRVYHAGRLQIAVAGPVDPESLAERIEERFAGLGAAELAGRAPVVLNFQPVREHFPKDLQQQYISIALPGAAKGDEHFPAEQVLLAVLSGGMSGRLFTEVREKLGLVYWVAAWHEQPRGLGVLHLGASTTPERCDETYAKILHELRRVGQDLTAVEVDRARNSLISHMETEDDLTRARAGALSDDLFHFGRPIGRAAKLDRLRKVRTEQVTAYAQQLALDRLCVATLGPRGLGM